MEGPRVIGYTPAWLSKPNPGHEIFTAGPTSGQTAPGNGLSYNDKRTAKLGPRRTIARRGTEIFIAVGKEIRWADLVYLKESWEGKQENQRSFLKGKQSRYDSDSDGDAQLAQGYRTLKTPAADDIRQLIISPNSNYLAILTTHNVYIAVLPEPSHLTAPETGPMKIKTFTLGPTTHVTSRSGIASAIWHPLGVNGSCLVTVTKDAIVRVWELSTVDRQSFDKPTLAIDLKKLVDGISADQDYGASVAGRSSKFSPDTFEMEVASACFASRGSGGWSPMTLWVAMREGDVYALCPLLPEKWSPPPTLIPSLSVSIVSHLAAVEDDPEVSQRTKLLAQQQLDWISEIDSQEPTQVQAYAGEPPVDVYNRPARPGKVPKLQGPFEIELAPEETGEENYDLLSDIYVIGPKLDAEELMEGEEDDLEADEVDQEGLSLGVVCLLTSSGRLSVCLDLVGVEAQWLPRSNSRMLRFVDDTEPTLLTFQIMETSKPSEIWEGSWPVFSNDVVSKYAFYVTNTSGITYISLAQWVLRLESELVGGVAGRDFRLDLIVRSKSVIRKRVHSQQMLDRNAPLTACTVIHDPDLGYFVLSATPHGPVSINFESPTYKVNPVQSHRSSSYDSDTDIEKPLVLYDPRPVYEPSYAFEEPSALPSLHEKLKHSKYKRIMKEEVRLSPAALTIMTDVHQVLSEETHRIGTAAAELFRKCIKLQIDLANHIRDANDLAGRVDSVIGEDYDETGDKPREPTSEAIERRIREAQEKQKSLAERIENMRKKVSRGAPRELSDKEKAWTEEVKSLSVKVLGEDPEESTSSIVKVSKEPWQRYEEVKELEQEVLEQVNEIAAEEGEKGADANKDFQVPSEIRKAKVEQVMQLLERETALVEATKERLERLSMV
ncbi:nuclear pore complex An-Nup82 protein [Rutstroemia sp. NJR-2017a WRK4]|nr:nuclear pore complex An-Nup82 protein [Rutstroemia sp. NJR-2017a WRK4]